MQSEKLSTPRMIRGIVLSVAALIVAQILALVVSEILAKIGLNAAICNIIAGLLYVGFALIESKLLCEKILKMPMTEMRIPHIQLKGIWIISAVLMPLCVVLIAILSGGNWTKNSFGLETEAEIITSAISFYGIGAGIVEEITFRGIIMSCLERRFNVKAAIIIPSVLFGVVHIIGSDLSLINMIQVVVAGSVVGILFSFITYESGAIWNSAIVHAVWNATVGGGIIHIGGEVDGNSIFNFVLKNKSFILTGGDFGIEASLISDIAYLIFIVLAVVLIKRRKENKNPSLSI